MFKNYFKIAVRQLNNQRFYTLINVLGLALSVSFCLLISLYVFHELSYDRHHQHADDIYRVALDINLNKSVAKGTALPPPLAKTMVSDFPEVENAARMNRTFFNAGTNLMRREDEKQNSFQEHFVYIDHSFTEIFDFPSISGDPATWLNDPNTVIITERIAERFFQYEDPVGKYIILNDDPQNQRYQITGVIENIPSNSHFNYDYFMSMNTLDDSNVDNWVFNNYFTYVKLQAGTDSKTLKSKLYDFGIKYFLPQFRERMNIDLAEASKNGEKYNLFLQPLSEIHLHSSDFIPPLASAGDIRYLRLFSIVAVFLLFIAIINFINLSTARSANRAKEVGIRKVLGSLKQQLVVQFLVESLIIAIIAFVVGIFLAEIGLPLFNQLAGKELAIPYLSTWFIPLLLIVAIVTGLIAGAYPSLYLSGFSPIKVLKGKLSLGSKGGWLRSSLVVFQFAISTALIFGTLVVFQQMKFIQNKKIGFEKDQVLLIHDTYTLQNQALAFKEALKKLPEVKNASVGAFLPLTGGFRNQMMYHSEGKSDPSQQVPIQAWPVDVDYINTLGMSILQGRDFAKDRPSDSLAVILNEAALVQLEINGDPIGQRIKSPFDEDHFTIIGVIKDFNYETLKNEVLPLGLFLGNNNTSLSAKASTDDMDQLITKAESVWKQFAPHQAFRYSFLDERFDKMYDSEKRAASLFNVFAMLAIFIACLGLFALTTFMAEQRRKEIGIRKVLGSSVNSIVALLAKDFLKPVAIALLIGSPLAWYFMDQWLNNFAFRIDLGWSVFLMAAIIALVIAFLTICLQSIKAANANPIKSLRNE